MASDCVLLDICLPDAEGTVGVKRLAEDAPDTAIVVLTRATTEELGAAALSAGAQDYLIKGRVDEQLLARSVRSRSSGIGRRSSAASSCGPTGSGRRTLASSAP